MVHVAAPTMSVDPNSQDARARRAVNVFRSLQPVLTGYAQAITGRKDVQVLMSSRSNGETDGRRIMMRPPIALGDTTPHNPPVCNKRSPDKHQLCPACRKREEVMLPIFHEIAHIANDSFLKPSEDDIKGILADAVRASGSTFAKSKKWRMNTDWMSYMEIAKAISEFLPSILNVLEDARIDSAMFRARPGIKPMYWSMLNTIRDRGIEGQDPLTGEITYTTWAEQPLNYQVVFGCWGIITKYDTTGWFHPDVEDALLDDKLRKILYSVRKLTTVRDIYRKSFEVLERLRELGYCQLPDEPLPSEDEGGNDDATDNKDEESSDAEDTSGNSESSGDGDGKAEGSSPGGRGSPSSGDPESEDEDEPTESDPEDPEDDIREPGEPGPDEEEDSSRERDDDSDPGSDGDVPAGDDEADDDDPDGSSDDWADEDSDNEVDEREDGSEADDDEDGRETPRPELGGPEDMKVYIIKADGHEVWAEKVDAKEEAAAGRVTADEDQELTDDEKAIIIAIIQGLFFDRPSANVTQVNEHHFDKPDDGPSRFSLAWKPKRRRGYTDKIEIPQAILGKALMKMRIAFSENYRQAKLTDLKSGRVNGRVLGRRAPVDDERLFMTRTKPGRRKYHVVIGLDCSGSTGGQRIENIKRAAYGQAELCHRTGIDFEMYAHTGSLATGEYNDDGTYCLALDIYVIKELNEPWNDKTKERLSALSDSSANIDGHTLEYYRKRLDAKRYTDSIIVYYTDGAMPMENYEEELEILLREIRVCRQKKYTLLFVGVNNDEPKVKYGLDMVRLDSDADIVKVVEALGDRLAS